MILNLREKINLVSYNPLNAEVLIDCTKALACTYSTLISSGALSNAQILYCNAHIIWDQSASAANGFLVRATSSIFCRT